MIKEFVEKFNNNTDILITYFSKKHPVEYKDIVKAVVGILGDKDEYAHIDPERIHEIDDGDYQGTLLFVVGSSGYQPTDYWYVKVAYGSCSGCDTLEGIRQYSYDAPTEEQVNDYMTLALHIVQGIKKMED